MSTYTQEILQLEALLNAAAKDVSTDGLRMSVDLSEARRRLAELRQLEGNTTRARPRIIGLKLGSAW